MRRWISMAGYLREIQSFYCSEERRALMIEFSPVTSRDFMTPELISGAYEAQCALAGLFEEKLSRTVALEAVVLDGTFTIPFPRLINSVENNLAVLALGGYSPNRMQPVRRWLGENADAPRLCYLDVNRWYQSAQQIEELIYGICGRMLRTGTFSSGESRTFQLHQRG